MLLTFASTSLFLISCDTATVYKAHEEMKNGEWFIDKSPQFTVTIEDTTQRYNVYYLVRNALQYPYYNLYLTRTITGPDSALHSSELVELMISDPETGKPYGEGLGDLFDHKIPLWENHIFPKSGDYSFQFTQAMRQNPLPYVLSVGLLVEKVEEK